MVDNYMVHGFQGREQHAAFTLLLMAIQTHAPGM